MNDRVALTCAMRLGGFVLIAYSLPQLGMVLYGLWQLLFVDTGAGGALGTRFFEQFLFSGIASVPALLLGLHLVLSGEWLVDRWARRVVGLCARCGYERGSKDSARCPECGHVAYKVVRVADGTGAGGDSSG